MKRRLAMASARGWRQASLVNELLAGPVSKREDRFGHVQVGESRVGWGSFVNLRDRLVMMGFAFNIDHAYTSGQIVMMFPEGDK